jgi:hypothetical protein
MGIKSTRFKGRVKIKGRPKEQAKAEIMVMKAQERYEDKQRRRKLFTLLDFVIVIAFGLSIYSVWAKEYLNSFLFLIIGASPLGYFIVRRIMKNREKR